MKRNITTSSLILFTILSLFVTNCKEENDYNFDNIEPELVGGIYGPKQVTATGFSSYNYEVIHRGGSEYGWSVQNFEASINKNSQYPNQASIKYNKAQDSTWAIITVKETSAGGKTATVKDTVHLLPFCPYPMEEYTGNWSSSDTTNIADTVKADTTDTPNQLRMYGLTEFINTRWGENWVNGDGSCVIEFTCNDVIKIERQWIGDTDYPDSYEIEGAGTVNTSNKTIHLNYYVFYAGGSSHKPISTTLEFQ